MGLIDTIRERRRQFRLNQAKRQARQLQRLDEQVSVEEGMRLRRDLINKKKEAIARAREDRRGNKGELIKKMDAINNAFNMSFGMPQNNRIQQNNQPQKSKKDQRKKSLSHHEEHSTEV